MQVEETVNPTTNAPVFSTCMPHGNGGISGGCFSISPRFSVLYGREGLCRWVGSARQPFSSSSFWWGAPPLYRMVARGLDAWGTLRESPPRSPVLCGWKVVWCNGVQAPHVLSTAPNHARENGTRPRQPSSLTPGEVIA